MYTDQYAMYLFPSLNTNLISQPNMLELYINEFAVHTPGLYRNNIPAFLVCSTMRTQKLTDVTEYVIMGGA